MQKLNYQNVAHVHDGDRHAVAAALWVLITPADAGGYVAQGLQIDYVATADTLDEVKDRFAQGLLKTIESLIRRNRPLSALFKSKTPPEAWQAYMDSTRQDHLVCGTVVDLRQKLPAGSNFPFSALEYCESSEALHA